MLGDPRGSMWRRWDLHVHSPFSFHWRGARFSGDAAADERIVEEMLNAMNQAEAAAFCIMDYWTFEGWFAFRRYSDAHPGELQKRVFPGIELRLEAPTDYRLNTHFLFDDSLTDQQLREFHSELRIALVDRPPTAEAFAELARRYDDGKLHLHGFSPADREDDGKMAQLGAITAKISRDSWRKASTKLKGHLLLVQPYDTSDGLEELDWKRHPYDDAELMAAAHFFETRNAQHVRLFLGLGDPKKPSLSENFLRTLGGRWKPVVSGSDAHAFTDYGVFPEGKAGWIKADPTFAGLRQCMVDPISRVFVGQVPPKVRHFAENPTKYMTRLRIRKVTGDAFTEKWFDCDMPLNPGMIAVIGNRGSGKSALADIFALCGNSHCGTFEFLNHRRFLKGSANRGAHYEAILSWANGEEVTVSLASKPSAEQPERVRYLPQQYLEDLCAEPGSEGQTTFESELRKIVFSHVPSARRLGLESLEELVKYRTQQIEDHAAGMRHKLAALNGMIADLEKATQPENVAAVKAQIQLKEAERIAHEAQQPTAVAPPAQRKEGEEAALVDEIDALQLQMDALDRALLVEREALVRAEIASAAALRVVQRLRNLEQEVRRTIEEAAEDARLAGIDVNQLVHVRIDIKAAAETQGRLQEEAREVVAKVLAMESARGALGEQIEVAREKASEPERLYQEYLSAQRAWEQRLSEIVGAQEEPGSLAHLSARLRELTTSAPDRLSQLKIERLEVARTLYGAVEEQLAVYRELYAPIEAVAGSHAFLRDSLRLEFNVVIEGSGFSDRLLASLNQGRRGTYYGHLEGGEAARRLVQSASFGTWDGVSAFLSAALQSLETDQRDGKGTTVSLASQLREGFSVKDVYDLIFGLTYLRPRLTLQLGGKEVGELSPGERGILLLVFYLLLDKEEIPLVIDQPEHNLDNASVYHLLGPCIRRAKNRRQIILVTHNPNVAIACDAEQVIAAEIDKQDGYKVTYRSGAIENPALNLDAVNVLEGTWPAFEARDAAYQRPSASTLLQGV